MITIVFFILFYNIDILNTFSELYSQKKYEEFVINAEKFLIEENDVPISGGLINQYISVCEKTNKNPTVFLKKLSTLKKDYTITEYAIFSTGYYYYKKDFFVLAKKYFEQLEEKHHSKSLVYDDALWLLFDINKRFSKHSEALRILNKIIKSYESSVYTGSYNMFHFYDAYIEKYFLLKDKLNKETEAINVLTDFTEKFDDNDKVDDALFYLCQYGFNKKLPKYKKYCEKLIKNYYFSPFFEKGKEYFDKYSFK